MINDDFGFDKLDAATKSADVQPSTSAAAPKTVGAPRLKPNQGEAARDAKRSLASLSGSEFVDTVHLRDHLRTLYKRRWPAAATFVIVLLASIVFTFTVTPVYEATAKILIENDDPNVVSFQEVDSTQRTGEYYQTQYRILQSRALARRTLDTLNLWNNEQFSAAAAKKADDSGITGTITAPFRAVTAWFSGDGSKAGEPRAEDESAVQAEAIDRFLEHLQIVPVRLSRLVDVKFRSPDPKLSAEVINALAKGYIQQNLENRLTSSEEATAWLTQQLSEQRKQVESTERAMQQYREQNDAVSLEDRQNIVVQKLAEINAAVTRARTDRMQKEAAYNQVRTVEGNRASLDTLPAIVNNLFIQQQKANLAELRRQQVQLGEKLLPRHPDMLKMAATIDEAEGRIRAEINKVVESMRNDYQQALANEQSLARSLEQQKQEALALDRKGIDYGVLTRNAAANRQMFESLMQRMKETGVSGQLRTSNIRIVDEADVPREPVFPRTTMNLLLGLMLAPILAAGLAFTLEHLDNRIKTPDEIGRFLQVPFLGIVPLLHTDTKDQSLSPLINNSALPAGFSESFRSIRTSLLFSSAEQGARTVAVTSTAPGEGKTLVASNIAVALALSGSRVLLIDADLRRPRIHEVFRRSQKPGFSNVLAANHKASECVHKTSVPGLWVMPAGEHPPNPAELLGSERCGDFIVSLGEHFEWIILDLPPVMAVTDAVVMAHRVSSVLFVIGCEMTPRSAVSRAIEQLRNVNSNFAGAVLNRVNLEQNPYYYSDYYRREYTESYSKPAARA